MYMNNVVFQNNPSPVGVQVKDQTRHAGLLSIKAANEWIQDSLKRPDPQMYFNNLIVQYENTVIFAASNVGKSILATQIAEDIAKTMKASKIVSTDEYTAFVSNDGKAITVFDYNAKSINVAS